MGLPGDPAVNDTADHLSVDNAHAVAACAEQQQPPTAAADNNNAAFFHNASSKAPRASIIPEFISHVRKPSAAGLHVHTELANAALRDDDPAAPRRSLDSARGGLLPSPSNWRRGSITSHRSLDDLSGTFSPSSTVSSPALAPLNDPTPLPSPLVRSGSPELWRRVVGRRRGSSGSSLRDDPAVAPLPPAALQGSPSRPKKTYPNLGSPTFAKVQDHDDHHSRNRSISEYVPDILSNIRPRNVTTPVAQTAKADPVDPLNGLHREDHLVEQRRKQMHANDPVASIPTPPESNRGALDSDDEAQRASHRTTKQIRVHAKTGEVQRWYPIRELGRGAFSEVVLATKQDPTGLDGATDEKNLDPLQLVAIKIVSHDPQGGSDEDRMETSIGREIDILQSLSHPCLPHLLAFDDSKTRALLVLNYCPGGDMFELASSQRQYLTPALIQRIFAELVAAVEYLHSQYIVHRDIKLENILFGLSLSELPLLQHPQSYPHPLITLTDMGLSKRIPPPPASPLLTHHCGSADYAAPELLLQQPYDGRTTDMWALGVVLYALMEGRLPFDPLPGKRRQGSAKHRIARCDWLWCEYGDEYGDWQESKGKGLEGARQVVEGVLRKVGRGRWSQEQVANHPWVKTGIMVKGGLTVHGTDMIMEEG